MILPWPARNTKQAVVFVRFLAKRQLAMILSLAASCASAWADESATSVEGQSATVENGGGSALSLDKFYASFYGNLEGGRLSQFGPYEANPTTGEMSKEAVTLASTATIAYMVTPQIGVGTYLEMNITPVFGEGWQWLDVGVTAFDRKLISGNGLTLSANLIAEVPTDTYDIGRGMAAGFETTPSIRYEIPHSRFSVGAWTELKNYAGAHAGKLIKTYYEPYVAYQLISQLSLNLTYELEWDHFVGGPGMQVYETDIQPGLLWYLTPKIIFNPFLMWFTNNRMTADTACFGASIVARVL
jgi:hypothetical protein